MLQLIESNPIKSVNKEQQAAYHRNCQKFSLVFKEQTLVQHQLLLVLKVLTASQAPFLAFFPCGYLPTCGE